MNLRSTLLPLLALGGLAGAPAQAQWSTDSLSIARTNMASVTVGDYVLFAGGRVGNTVYDRVDIYDTTTGAWSTAALSWPRSNMAATVVGDLAFFAGGAGVSFALWDVVDVYDASVGLPSNPAAWSTVTLSQARASLAATTVGSKAFFAGGGGIGFVSSRVDVYDASVGLPSNPAAWSTETLSLPRSGICAATVGNLALFAGGSGIGGVPFDTVDIYDNSSGTWSTAPLSVARLLGGDAAAVVGTRVYFGGGHFSQSGGPNMSDAVDIFDAQTGGWSDTTLSVARGYVGVSAVGNTVLFCGGSETGHSPSDVVDALNVGTGLWNATYHLSQARRGVAAVAVGGRAMFAGGAASGAASAVVDVFEPVGVSYCVGTSNSTGAPASIRATGSSLALDDDLTLTADQLPQSQFGYFLNSMTQGFAANPGGSQGTLCLSGSIGRYSQHVLNSGLAGTASLQLDLADTPTPTGPVSITAGQTWSFQFWYRDLNPATTSNFTDGVFVTFH